MKYIYTFRVSIPIEAENREFAEEILYELSAGWFKNIRLIRTEPKPDKEQSS